MEVLLGRGVWPDSVWPHVNQSNLLFTFYLLGFLLRDFSCKTTDLVQCFHFIEKEIKSLLKLKR